MKVIVMISDALEPCKSLFRHDVLFRNVSKFISGYMLSRAEGTDIRFRLR
jgi:hypothetical protein